MRERDRETREAFAEQRAVAVRSAAVKKEEAKRLVRLCPDMTATEISERLGICDRTLARWMAKP